MFELLRFNVTAFVPNCSLESTISTSSPTLGEAGKVTVTAPPVVLIKYPSPATAVKSAVFSACQLIFVADSFPNHRKNLRL